MKFLPVEQQPIFDLARMVADVGHAPMAWQMEANQRMYGSTQPAVLDSEELQRVAALPWRARFEEGTSKAHALGLLIAERFARPNPRCKCADIARKFGVPPRDCITSLRLVQNWALYELGTKGGLLGAIGVGHGKTILDILAPLAVRDCFKAVLLVPPGLVQQLIIEYWFLREHFHVPGLISHAAQHCNERVDGKPTLHIFPYSRLSRPDATDWFSNYQPDLIIADECHMLRSADAARTTRVLRYFASNHHCRFAGWTGSLTDSSLKDYAHLSALALREGSPLPLNKEVLEEWAGALSTSGDDVQPRPPGALLQLCEPGEHVRDGFRRRLAGTPGVITTNEASVDVPMFIGERNPGKLPDKIRGLLNDLRGTWCRPDGEELMDALAVHRCARELSCGLFNRWEFPGGEPVELIKRWLELRKEWNKAVRNKLFTKTEHMDSPFLVELAAKRAWGDAEPVPGRPTWEHPAWPPWRDIKDQVKHITVPQRVDDFLVQDAAKWAHENRGIVWYDIDDFGTWLAQVSGLPKHGGGPKAPALLAQERGDRSIICSIKSHGTGRDGLQRIFNAQLVAQPPSSSAAWEQLLGRLHRQGQKREVSALFYRHTPELRAFIDQALRRAMYVQATLGSRQKIIQYELPPASEDEEDVTEWDFSLSM